MKRKATLYVAWAWAITVATLPEFVYFVYLGFAGMAQAGVILLLAWILFERTKGPAIFAGVIVLSAMNGPPVNLVDTMFGRMLDLDHFLRALDRAGALLILRSAVMLVALAPLAVFHLRNQKTRRTSVPA
jgi:hypothetical protein